MSHCSKAQELVLRYLKMRRPEGNVITQQERNLHSFRELRPYLFKSHKRGKVIKKKKKSNYTGDRARSLDIQISSSLLLGSRHVLVSEQLT